MTVVSYPLDVARTRLSVDMGTSGVSGSLTRCLKQITVEEGWRALYRGVGLSLISSVPYATVALTSYDNLKGRYERASRANEGSTKKQESTTLDRLLGKRRKHSIMAGSISFTFASALVYPIDTVRRRLIVDGGPGHQRRLYERATVATSSTSSITNNVGIKSDGTGTRSTSRSFSTNVLRQWRGEHSGGDAVGQTVAESWAHRGPKPVQLGLRMWHEEGVIGFYRGLFPSLLRGMPRAAIMFFVYDVMKSSLTPRANGLRRSVTRYRQES